MRPWPGSEQPEHVVTPWLGSDVAAMSDQPDRDIRHYAAQGIPFRETDADQNWAGSPGGARAGGCPWKAPRSPREAPGCLQGQGEPPGGRVRLRAPPGANSGGNPGTPAGTPGDGLIFHK